MSQRSRKAIEVASDVVKSHFGKLVQKVALRLLQYGPQTLPVIITFTELKYADVRNCLLVLMQHSCVVRKAMLGHADDFTYEASLDDILRRIRFPRILSKCQEKFKRTGMMVAQQLCEYGMLKKKQVITLVLARVEEAKEQGDNGLVDVTRAKLSAIFDSMVSKGYLKGKILSSSSSSSSSSQAKQPGSSAGAGLADVAEPASSGRKRKAAPGAGGGKPAAAPAKKSKAAVAKQKAEGGGDTLKFSDDEDDAGTGGGGGGGRAGAGGGASARAAAHALKSRVFGDDDMDDDDGEDSLNVAGLADPVYSLHLQQFDQDFRYAEYSRYVKDKYGGDGLVAFAAMLAAVRPYEELAPTVSYSPLAVTGQRDLLSIVVHDEMILKNIQSAARAAKQSAGQTGVTGVRGGVGSEAGREGGGAAGEGGGGGGRGEGGMRELTEEEMVGKLYAFSLDSNDIINVNSGNAQQPGASYVINFTKFNEMLARRQIESIINTQYGPDATRIYRLLSSRELCEDKEVADIVMLRAKDSRMHLFQMHEERLVQMQEVSKSKDFDPNKTFYLWSVNPILARDATVDRIHHAMHNVNIQLSMLLNKGEQLPVPLLSATCTGEYEAFQASMPSAINQGIPTPGPLLHSALSGAKLETAVQRLDSTILKLDMTLMILRDCKTDWYAGLQDQ